MARPRQIKKVTTDENGATTAVHGSFGTRTLKQAVRDIESGAAAYESGGSRVNVVKGQTKKYLRTSPDSKTSNNLDNR